MVRLASWAYKQTSGQHDLFHERVSNPLCGRMLGMGPPNKIGAINAEFRCFGTTETCADCDRSGEQSASVVHPPQRDLTESGGSDRQ